MSRKYPWLIVVVLLACASFAHAQGKAAAAGPARANMPAGEALLLLRTGTVDLSTRPTIHLARPVYEAGTPYVLHLDGPMTPARQTALDAAGVVLGQYLPIHAYLVELGGANAAALAELDFVDWVGPYEDAWKFSPAIGPKEYREADRQAMERGGRKLLIAEWFGDKSDQHMKSDLEKLGAVVRGPARAGDRRQMIVEMGQGHVNKLSQARNVLFVEEAPEAEPRNATSSWIIQSNVTNSRPLWDAGLLGQDQIVGIIDWDMRADHCAFADPDGHPIGPSHRKILAYYGMGISPGFGYHGTHVAGVAAGDELANTNPELKGMAYKSKIVFQHYNGVLEGGTINAFNRLTVAHNDGARVHNNSWGNNDFFYNTWARDIDLFTRNNEDDLVLIAVINSGQVRAPENAKNGLAVAGSRDTPNQHQHCSGGFGPTADGRQKPEVFGVSCGSRSADVNNICGNSDTGSGGGTSYATPGVAGMAVLMRQYFMEGFYPTGVAIPSQGYIPSGALLKSLIVNSAVDMTGLSGYFTTSEGWGRILVDHTLYFAGDDRRLLVEDIRNADGLSTGQTTSYLVSVGPGAMPLKITLVWTDAPAAVMATFTPINNLDLVVTSPTANVYRGNVFSGTQSTTGGTADTVNNAEQVHRTSPESGVWQIDVVGSAVNVGAQGYALVVSGDVDCLKGDVNGDGIVNGEDIGPFVRVLLEGGTFFQRCTADMNTSGEADVLDVDEFVESLLY